MPRLDGISTVNELRTIPAYKETPVLALTANVLPEDRALCESAGMDSFLAKPIRKATVCQCLQEIAKRYFA
jgi:CheY-like chemotaxis protein